MDFELDGRHHTLSLLEGHGGSDLAGEKETAGLQPEKGRTADCDMLLRCGACG